MMLSVRTAGLPAACAILIMLAPDTTYAAPLAVSDARIGGGKLLVTGTTPQARQGVNLDGRFRATSNAQRRFSFSLSDYHPDACVVEVRAGAAKAAAVVAGCGEAGLKPRGGWAGATSYAADDLVGHAGSLWRAKAASKGRRPDTHPALWEQFAAKGDGGAAGRAGAPGAPGVKGDKGTKGDPGLPGAPGGDGADGAAGATGPIGNPAASLQVIPLDIVNCALEVPRLETRVVATKTLTVADDQQVTVSASVPVRLPDGWTGYASVDYGFSVRGEGLSYQGELQNFFSGSAPPHWSGLAISASGRVFKGGELTLNFYVENDNPNAAVKTGCPAAWVMVTD